MWDLFISYASEDKHEFVAPLAKELKEHSLDVWYDEFELKIGDSLSKSIDKGLSDSKFGLIIFSKNFFNKGWTDYELRSLLSKETFEKNTVILPIWHKINPDDIIKYSPYLADKYALSTDIGLEKLVYKIIEVVKPSLINSYNLTKYFREILPQGKLEEVDIRDLKDGPIRHESLPIHLLISSKLMCSLLDDVTDMDFKKTIINFAQDVDYDHEFLIWNAICISYINFIKENKVDFNNIKIKTTIFSFLLGLTTGAISSYTDFQKNNSQFTLDQYYDLALKYFLNHDFLLDCYGEDMQKTYPKFMDIYNSKNNDKN